MAAWQLFKRHHYLSGSPGAAGALLLDDLGRRTREFLCDVAGDHQDAIIAGSRGSSRCPIFRASASACGPMAAVAELHRAEGLRINVTSSHPALIRHCRRSPLWKAVNVKKSGIEPVGDVEVSRSIAARPAGRWCRLSTWGRGMRARAKTNTLSFRTSYLAVWGARERCLAI